jgi:hypothetical protein
MHDHRLDDAPSPLVTLAVITRYKPHSFEGRQVEKGNGTWLHCPQVLFAMVRMIIPGARWCIVGFVGLWLVF